MRIVPCRKAFGAIFLHSSRVWRQYMRNLPAAGRLFGSSATAGDSVSSANVPGVFARNEGDGSAIVSPQHFSLAYLSSGR